MGLGRKTKDEGMGLKRERDGEKGKGIRKLVYRIKHYTAIKEAELASFVLYSPVLFQRLRFHPSPSPSPTFVSAPVGAQRP
jgi:hypothetical protein